MATSQSDPICGNEVSQFNNTNNSILLENFRSYLAAGEEVVKKGREENAKLVKANQALLNENLELKRAEQKAKAESDAGRKMKQFGELVLTSAHSIFGGDFSIPSSKQIKGGNDGEKNNLKIMADLMSSKARLSLVDDIPCSSVEEADDDSEEEGEQSGNESEADEKEEIIIPPGSHSTPKGSEDSSTSSDSEDDEEESKSGTTTPSSSSSSSSSCSSSEEIEQEAAHDSNNSSSLSSSSFPTWSSISASLREKAEQTLKNKVGGIVNKLTCNLEGPVLVDLTNGKTPPLTDLYGSIFKTALKRYNAAAAASGEGGGGAKLAELNLLNFHSKLAIQRVFPQQSNKLSNNLFKPICSKEVAVKVGMVEEEKGANWKLGFLGDSSELANYFVALWMVDKLRRGDWNSELTGFLGTVLKTDWDECYDSDCEDTELKDGDGEKSLNCYCDCHEDNEDEERRPYCRKFANRRSFLPLFDYLMGEQLETLLQVEVIIDLGSIYSESGMENVAQACAHDGYINILSLLNKVGKYKDYHVGSLLFTDASALVALERSRVGFLKMANSAFENHGWMDKTLKEKAFHRSLKRGEASMVEFFVGEMGLDDLVKGPIKPNSELLYSLDDCMEDSYEDSEETIGSKLGVLRCFNRINGSLLLEWVKRSGTFLHRRGIHSRLLLLLLELGCDVLECPENNSTLLHENYSREDYDALLNLIPSRKLKSLMNKKDDYNADSPLLSALRMSTPPSLGALKKLKEAGVDFQAVDKYNKSALAIAIENCVVGMADGSVLKQLIDYGAKTTWKGGNNEGLLHLAASRRNAEVVEALLHLPELNLGVNCKDNNGLTPLDYAIQNGYDSKHEIGMALHRSGAQFSNNPTVLRNAVKSGNINTVRLLLELGMDVGSVDGNGNGLLHYAVGMKEYSWDQVGTVNLLISKGADKYARNKLGQSPFLFGIMSNKMKLGSFRLLKPSQDPAWQPWLIVEVMKFIIFKNADDYDYSREEIEDLLAAEGLDRLDYLQFRNENGDGLMHIAASCRNKNMIKFLLKRGFDINARNGKGETPIHHVAHPEMVQCLGDNGANLLATDENGDTFLQKLLQSNKFRSGGLSQLFSYFLLKNCLEIFGMRGGENGSTMLQMAALKFSMGKKTLLKLYSRGVDFREVDNNKDSILAYAIRGAEKPSVLVSNLVELELGLDLAHRNAKGQGLLHVAVEVGDLTVVSLLLGKGRVDPNGVDRDWNTPLHWLLMQEGNGKTVEWIATKLIGSGGKVTVENNKGLNPYAVATQRKDGGMSDKLKQLLMIKKD